MSDLAVKASPDSLAKLQRMQTNRRRHAHRQLSRYYDDPVAFSHDCVDWPEGESLAEYQEEALASIPEQHKVCVRSLHGTGKTTMESLAVLWFSLTRDALGRDWKCPTTAGAWNQLERYLWPEIHKWARRIRWDKIHRDPFRPQELLGRHLNLRFGSAFAVASAIPAYIEGVHADSVLYIFDEGKAIPDATFDAAEGAFTGAEGTEALALAASTPGEPKGRFYDIQSRKPGLEDWHIVHITLERAIASGRVSADWAERRKAQWGANSTLYHNRVLGEFHAADEDAVVPLAWIELAVERWKDAIAHLPEGTATEHTVRLFGPMTSTGVDVARFGDDQTVLALCHGPRVQEIRYSFHEATTMTAGRVKGILDANPECVAIVDCDGIGSGVFDMLKDEGCKVEAFHGSGATNRKDKSGELGFRNKRSAAIYHLREVLDPHPCMCPVPEGVVTPYCAEHGSEVQLPDDPRLLGDLMAAKSKPPNIRGEIQVESKDDIKKRIQRSPDVGDAVMYALWPGERPRRKRRMVAAGALPRKVNAA